MSQVMHRTIVIYRFDELVNKDYGRPVLPCPNGERQFASIPGSVTFALLFWILTESSHVLMLPLSSGLIFEGRKS